VKSIQRERNFAMVGFVVEVNITVR